ncbi:GntR family transcriptional regulator [Pseudokineococcus sp. 1T1Z-3]|uniref:GntR family transcriptional regulator n=1 Tax=Pseudokineococcus sp. 1T1Z-3 TaxID=3132745 RepID=UPI00309552C9
MAHVNAPRTTEVLRRQLLRDEVYDALLDMLLDQRLAPGGSLSIDGLARELGVSPTPVREALAFLEHTGLVVRTALKGYAVAPHPGAEQLGHLMEARSVLEIEALRRAVAREGLLAGRLREAHAGHEAAAAAMVDAWGPASPPPAVVMRHYFEADWAFHLSIVEASGNPYLRDMLQGLGTHLHRLVQSAGRGVTDWQAALAEHGRILRAVEGGDPDQAVAAMAEHLAGVRERAVDDTLALAGRVADRT